MKQNNDFISSCTSGGCGAKIGAAQLSGILSSLPNISNKSLLVGYHSSDDAAVYSLDGGEKIISTLDFFSPMVPDPYVFGQIAAANALSDVYAMGGEPLFALNIVCFPEQLDLAILQQILQGGAKKAAEAGVVIAGGHSIYDKETKYGLSVTGKAIDDRFIQNSTPRVGDTLILTKALGTGIVMAAQRVDCASAESYDAAVASMTRLNKYSAEKMRSFAVSACTDITGFSLLGHASEMAGDTLSIEIGVDQLPLLPNVLDYAADFLTTAAGQRNRNFLGDRVDLSHVHYAMQEVLFDPQTSGGLLIAVDESEADSLLSTICETDSQARKIGRLLPKQEKSIVLV